ncbi:MAG: hypothetical protein RL398_183 [Planctomycetota bacterium]|jgi:predicted PurR-regulated permease PerM
MSSSPETPERALPPPWDRIFSLATRTFVWAMLIGVLYLLRPFFLLIFLTFVFAYIQAHGVDGLQHRIKRRWVRVVVVGLVFIGTLFATGFTLFPEVRDQAGEFLRERDRLVADADKEINKFLRQYPSLFETLSRHQEELPDPALLTQPPKDPPEQPQPEQPNPQPQPEKKYQDLQPVKELVAGLGKSFAENPLAIGQSVLGYATSFLLSLLFSFLIVLDLPKLTRGVNGLARTRVGFIYDEVADNIAGFGRVLGRALEAQLFIAVCNTILTAIGIWMMGLDNLLVLSAIVFFCSFIPVFGTFLSTTPICLLALQSGGVSSMVLVIVLISVIHALETYVLNPQIYGHHMHMNPVLVLIVLTISGQLFGVWGLILGIPIVNYVFRHAIRYPAERPAET